MSKRDVIKNLFTSKYTHDEKVSVIAELELKNPPLLDRIMRKYQPLFWSEHGIHILGSNHGKFAGYETHTLSFNLLIALEKYQKDSNFKPGVGLEEEMKKFLKK